MRGPVLSPWGKEWISAPINLLQWCVEPSPPRYLCLEVAEAVAVTALRFSKPSLEEGARCISSFENHQRYRLPCGSTHGHWIKMELAQVSGAVPRNDRMKDSEKCFQSISVCHVQTKCSKRFLTKLPPLCLGLWHRLCFLCSPLNSLGEAVLQRAVNSWVEKDWHW